MKSWQWVRIVARAGLAAVTVMSIAWTGWVIVHWPPEPPRDGLNAARSGDGGGSGKPLGEIQSAVFFGDSYVNGSSYTTPRQSMGYLAGQLLGYRTVVLGAGGTGFTVGNAQTGEGTFDEQIRAGDLKRVSRPDLVVVEGGLNDRSSPPEKVRKNAEMVIGSLRNEWPKVTVVLVGPTDPDGDYRDTRPVVDALADAAATAKVPFIDASAWLAGKETLLGADGVHPTVEGHRVLAVKLAGALRRVIDHG